MYCSFRTLVKKVEFSDKEKKKKIFLLVEYKFNGFLKLNDNGNKFRSMDNSVSVAVVMAVFFLSSQIMIIYILIAVHQLMLQCDLMSI